MPNPVAWWNGLSRAWKGVAFGFLIGILWFAWIGLLFADPALALVSSLLWGAALGSAVRLSDRLKRGPGGPRGPRGGRRR